MITSGSGAGTPDMVSICDDEDKAGVMIVKVAGLFGRWRKDVKTWSQPGGKKNGWVKYKPAYLPNKGFDCPENAPADSITGLE